MGLLSKIYAELAGLYPSAAGLRVYVGQAFGPRRGLWISLIYCFLVVALGASESYILSEILSWIWLSLSPMLTSLAFVGLCALINILGFELTGRFQLILTFTLLAALLALSLFFLQSSPPLPALKTLSFDGLTIGIPGALFLFVGFEWVVSSVDNPEQCKEALPKAMERAILLLVTVYSLIALSFLTALPGEALTGAVPQLSWGLAEGKQAGLVAMCVLSILATVTSFNSGILGASRLIYGLAREGSLPSIFGRLHRARFTPWVAILAISTITAVSAATLASSKAVQVPILIGGSIECLVFAIVSLAFVKLRASKGERRRLYRAPFGRVIGSLLAALFFILSGACLFATEDYVLIASLSLASLILLTGIYSYLSRRFQETKRRKRNQRRRLAEPQLLERDHGFAQPI